MSCSWKENWEETKVRFTRWWERTGVVIGLWGDPLRDVPHAPVTKPVDPPGVEQHYLDAAWRARADRYSLAYHDYPLEKLPLAGTCIGPGSLALVLGARPEFEPDTVWYHPCIDDVRTAAPLVFVPENEWWQAHERILRAQLETSQGDYLVPCPDLIENIDILSSLRGAQQLMIDVLLEPDWVKARIQEINRVFFEAYTRVYNLIKDDAGGASFSAFQLWAPGKVAKVQADASAMLSPAQFEEFVAPALAEQCRWLDYSMYHLDGVQCIPHLDVLLSIEALDAIQWTPQDGKPGVGDPCWFDMYRRIIEAGKSLQVIGLRAEEAPRLFDAIGTNGVYAVVGFTGGGITVDAFAELLRGYRRPV